MHARLGAHLPDCAARVRSGRGCLGPASAGAAVVLAVLVLFPTPAAPQGPASAGRRVVAAVRLAADESIALDGRLDEPAWQRALPADGFLQQDPDNGAPATEPTEVRVLFDRHRLYLGVICRDSAPDRLLGNQMQRDQPFDADDRFRWVVDPFLDGRTGYFFEVNPSGAMGDGLLGIGASGGATSDESGLNRQWDGIWMARVRRTDTGWTAEIELPFRTLNFAPGATPGASTSSGPSGGRTRRRSGRASRATRGCCGWRTPAC